MVGWWIEAKREERLALPRWWRKLLEDIGDRPDKPLLAHRRNREEWLVTMRATDWADLIRHVERLQDDLASSERSRRDEQRAAEARLASYQNARLVLREEE